MLIFVTFRIMLEHAFHMPPGTRVINSGGVWAAEGVVTGVVTVLERAVNEIDVKLQYEISNFVSHHYSIA